MTRTNKTKQKFPKQPNKNTQKKNKNKKEKNVKKKPNKLKNQEIKNVKTFPWTNHTQNSLITQTNYIPVQILEFFNVDNILAISKLTIYLCVQITHLFKLSLELRLFIGLLVFEWLRFGFKKKKKANN